MITQTAYHEAGHAVAAWVLGCRHSGPMTIEGNDEFHGITFPGRPKRLSDRDLEGLDRPLPLLPAHLRRSIEITVMVLQAGPLAAGIFAPAPPSARRTNGVSSAQLPQREAALLAERRRHRGESDEEQIDSAMNALHGSRRAIAQAHMWLLEVETTRLLQDHSGHVTALATELEHAGTLSAQQWRRVLDRVSASV